MVVEKVGINAERVTRAEGKRDELLEILGAMLNDQKANALMRALAKGKGRSVTRLLAAGADPDASVMTGDWEHMTSLTATARYG